MNPSAAGPGKPGGAAKYPQPFIDTFIARRQLGEPNDRLCEELGINRKTGQKWWNNHRRAQRRPGFSNLPEPKTPARIRQHAAARRAYDDFAYFRLVCFGYETPPWQRAAAKKYLAAIEAGRRKFIVENVFPGAGKTEFKKHLILWLIARNRSRRFIWASASDERATQRVNEIRLELERTGPGEGSEIDIAAGRAVKPRYCMAELFGRFRPSASYGVRWSASEFTVATAVREGEGPPAPGPTLTAFGRRSKMLGPRAEFMVGDDVWDEEADRTAESGAAVCRWWDRTVVNRLQPNGVLALVMQRMSGHDITKHVLRERQPVRDPVTGMETGYEPTYEHIVYPAHHDDLCDGTHPDGRPAWDPENPVMGNCLTDPKALPPDDYLRVRGTALFLVVYQQRDADPAEATIREVWLTGGKDDDGVYRGCLDFDRGLWELPDDLPRSDLASAMAIDVGHVNYWGLYAAVHSTAPDTDMEWVLAAERRRMPSGTSKGLLDWDFERKCFVGLLEEWYQQSKELGVPFTHVVAEINAAQRHLFRLTNIIDKWQMTRNCRIISHETTRNKNDKKLGVTALLPMRYQLGAYRIPWRPGDAQHAMRALYDQAKGYQNGALENDIVMAQWMRTLNRRRIVRPVAAVPDRQVPGWVKGLARTS